MSISSLIVACTIRLKFLYWFLCEIEAVNVVTYDSTDALKKTMFLSLTINAFVNLFYML